MLGLAATALAVDPVWATVTGYAPATEDNNHAEAWGDNCETVAGISTLTRGSSLHWVKAEAYALVIVKAGSDATDENNTLFADPSAGETVWADSSENGSRCR